MSSTLFVDAIEPNLSSGVHIAGHVIQVVNATYNAQTSSTSSSYTDTGLTLSITPKFSTSKIYLVFNFNSSGLVNSGGADAEGDFSVIRDATRLVESRHRAYDYGNTGSIQFGSYVLTFLDSPATTSSITYKLQQKLISAGSSNIRINEASLSASVATLMEIAQ